MDSFRKKDSTKPRKSRAVTWGLGSNSLPSIFSAELQKVNFFIANVRRFLHLFLVVGKASRVHKLSYYFSSIVEQLLKLSTMCKSPWRGPRNYVDRTWERSANHCYHATPKFHLSSSSVRLIHSVWVCFFG